MKIKLYTDKYRGSIQIEEKSIEILDDPFGEMITLIDKVRTGGLRGRAEIINDKVYNLIEFPVETTNPNFIFHFLSFLKREGYNVEKDMTNIDKEINNLLENLKDSSLKEQLASLLPTMNYLEKTYILTTLG